LGQAFIGKNWDFVENLTNHMTKKTFFCDRYLFDTIRFIVQKIRILTKISIFDQKRKKKYKISTKVSFFQEGIISISKIADEKLYFRPKFHFFFQKP